MECGVCGSTDKLLYPCEPCGEWLCATHQDPDTHDCEGATGCAACDVENTLLFSCRQCGQWLCDDHHSPTAHECETVVECAVCGTSEELIYACVACQEWLCATHHGVRYHDCTPAPERKKPARSFQQDRIEESTVSVDRPEAQLYPQAVSADDGQSPPDPSEAARPGYGPERLSAEPVGPPETVSEWFRRQTYLSLTVKVGLIGSLCNLLVFSLIGAAMVFPFG